MTISSVKYYWQEIAPVYTFRVSPLPELYAEAKKCGVNMNADPAPAYQARHGKMVALVDSMLALHKQLSTARSAAQKAIL